MDGVGEVLGVFGLLEDGDGRGDLLITVEEHFLYPIELLLIKLVLDLHKCSHVGVFD